jgi:hypothetical protein
MTRFITGLLDAPLHFLDFMARNQPSWSQLKFFKNRYLFRFMSAWVLAAPLIEHVGRTLPKTLCAANICISLELPFSIRLTVISTLLLVASYSLYQLYCPSLIKSHDNFLEFYSSGATANSLIGLLKEFYFRRILPRNHDRIDLNDIMISYDNHFVQSSRPFF